MFIHNMTYFIINFVFLEICSCKSLRELSLRSNNLSNIPDGIGSLQNLVVLMLTQNKLKNLPLSVLKLKNLNALWLSENQSKPLTPLQNDSEDETGKHILTCYLLPQREDSFIGNLFIVIINNIYMCINSYCYF